MYISAIGRQHQYPPEEERHKWERFSDMIYRHLAIKSKAAVGEFGDTAKALANAVIAGDLDAARPLADLIIEEHS